MGLTSGGRSERMFRQSQVKLLRKFYMVMEPCCEETDFCYLGFFADAEKNASQKFFLPVCVPF